MKVSLNTVAQYVKNELPPVDVLIEKINGQLGAIEEVVDLGAKYKDARIVKVVECEKHPDADKLSVCLIDDGGVVQDVPRSESGLVQVVCGAPNVHPGMWAVWLPPKSTVPASFDDEPFVLDARKLRGVLSQGMLAAGDELGINDDHEGIIELTNYDIPEGVALEPGASFAEVFGLNDTIIDIENKMFTHRPDLFGQLGVAREIYAILQAEVSDGKHTEQHMIPSDWYWTRDEFVPASGLELAVTNEAIENVPRFMAVAMSDVTVKPSPLWLQCELIRFGSKPINNVVDVTNYIMLMTAQPVHAYDYDKLHGHALSVRMAKQDEEVVLLNDKTYKLDEDDIVIVDGEGVVGLAGIMGGNNSEVSDDTKNVVLEVATFDMYAVRRTSMRHGVFTDALTRFNKGQSKLQNDRVLARMMTLMGEFAGAKQASDVFDRNDFTADTDTNSLYGAQIVSVAFINERLGLQLSGVAVGNILRGANFAIFKPGDNDDELSVAAPFWRTDIETPEDIVEEVGRLYGYEKLPRELPMRSTKPTPKNEERELAHAVREALARAGANEVLTYSFVHERVLKAAGQNEADAYKLANALSPDLQYYRLSITPSLLDKVSGNIRAGYEEFALFEIGKSHSKKTSLDADGLPVEPGRIALTFAAKKAGQGAPYYRAKALLDFLGSALGLDLAYRPMPASSLAAAAPFADGRTARVIDQVSGQVIGLIGEYAPSVRKAFKLPEYSAGFELFTEGIALARHAHKTSSYKPLSRYPATERDVCFEVATGVRYDSVEQAVVAGLREVDELEHQVTPVDIYQTEESTKRITLRIRLVSHESTLTSERANEVIDAVATTAAEQLGATII